MQTISEIVRTDLSDYQERGGNYYDDTANKIAHFAVQSCMPELVSMRGHRFAVEANRAILLEQGDGDDSGRGEDEVKSLNGMYVEARLERVAIQETISTLVDTSMPIQVSDFDLYAVLTPVYRDPDPQDIIFGDELFVPFRNIESFESAK